MSLTKQNVEASLYDAIATVTTRKTIFYYPNAPRPDLPYNSIQFLNMAEALNDSAIFDTNDGVYKYLGFREVNYTINCFGNDSFDEALKLQIGFQKQIFRSKLKETYPISLLRMTAPNDITELVVDEFERRVTFDIYLYAAIENLTTTEDVGYFDKVGQITYI